jgi:hypothetical protein
MMEKLILFFVPQHLLQSEEYSLVRDNKIFISFILIIIIMLAIFTGMNYSAGKTIAGYIDFVMLCFFIALLFYNKQTSRPKWAIYSFLVGLLIILCSQHIIAPRELYSNLYWSSLFPIYICYLFTL